jgi:hypothetical protein
MVNYSSCSGHRFLPCGQSGVLTALAPGASPGIPRCRSLGPAKAGRRGPHGLRCLFRAAGARDA